MCFRNSVRWGIHLDNDPRKFMTVDSGEYVLAIPDYSRQVRKIGHGSAKDDESVSSADSLQNNAIFKKTIMKLSGNVRWLAGLVFERDLDEGGRSFEFIPHYQIAFKTPGHARPPPGQVSKLQKVYCVVLTPNRYMMHSGVSVVSISICLSL